MDAPDETDVTEESTPRSRKKGTKKKLKEPNNRRSLYLALGGGSVVIALLVGLGVVFLGGPSGDDQGVGESEPTGPAIPEETIRDNSKAIAIAMHNAHDQYRNFLHPDVSPEGTTGLSWRVHLLKHLGESGGPARGLYVQFHLNEPWDSPHNKTLIEKMPDVYQTPGVNAVGKTSWHIFTGPGTPGEKGPFGMKDIHDGSSNTILCILGGPESATEWTKPGGIPLNLAKPFEPLGKPVGGDYGVIMADGVARKLSALTYPSDAVALIQAQDYVTVTSNLFSDYGVSKKSTTNSVFPNLSLVSRGVLQHHEAHQRYPLASVPPGLSWRVAILPYINNAALYSRFHLDEPWDSPHNKTLIQEMPREFQSPGIRQAGMTTMHVVADRRNPFGGTEGATFQALSDGASNILLVLVGGPETATEWTRPGGLAFDEAAPLASWGTRHPDNGYPISTFDGAVKLLKADSSPAAISLIIQHSDGKPIDKSVMTAP